ncbi:uncharacterized protein LOC132756066 [Ruditapes philippinarum]|uniref:uncharacterized protein LOC132756066 n=1 Tax=Ruditapes philippinarum TaxID=129788 RepID=UPI00295B19CB|nr:uncharacterized protein LOC132756066 [Ruditapes philippinarum]XP_060603043.1 uncharacterized protein LOC132756066 [Ruditapes philippinarum]XP_060603051.1 uncharacterized protein LOC132756066 [Ruditapes philippinarum]
MATTKSSHSPQDNILCCPICMDIYKTPRMLPCQHTLCESCLHSYIVNKSRERVLVSDFPCPVCRAQTPAPRAFTRIDTWSTLFPLNHLLVSLLDSSFHEMLEKRETPTAVERCAEHAGKLIEFFCVEHNVKLCSKCFKNAHRQCEVLDIEEHAEFTTRFTIVKTDVENLLVYLNDAILHLKSNIEQLSTEKTSIMTEVKDFRGKVEALLNSFETDIKDQVNVQHDGEVVVLKAQCEKYERIKAEIETSGKTLSELPVSSQSFEMISTIENDIKSQSSFIHGCHSNIKVIKVEFAIENELLAFLNSFSKLGSVNVNHFESNLKVPPELMSRGNTLNESFIPSPRDVSADDLPSRSPIRHVSPRAIIIARPTLNDATSSQSGTNTEQRPHRAHKEPKRPKTVPIESTAPTPVVRPRPERPDIHGIRHFLPRSCSSPKRNQDYSHNTEINIAPTNEAKENVVDLSDDEDSVFSTGQSEANSNQDAAGINGCETPGDVEAKTLPGALTKPPTSEKPKNRVWHYVNVMSGVGDISSSKRMSERAENDESANGNTKFLFRHRSSSASSMSPEVKPIVSSAINQLARLFRPTQADDNPASPLYENSSIYSACSAQNKCNSKTLTFEPITSSNTTPKQCTKLKSVVIKVEGDIRECTITGSVELPDKRLILIDCNNSRVKLFNHEFSYVSHLDMAKEPWNVACLSSNEIAVTVPLEKTIHVIRVIGSSMSTQRCIVTRRECWGIAIVDGKFVVTTKDDGNQVAFLDDNGRELQVVNFASRENPNILRPVSVTRSRTDHVLYICCEGQSGTKGSLVRMSTRGDVLYVFTHKELDRPYSTAVDREDNVYVTAIRSANVLMLSEGGASVMTILSRDLGLTRPQHIHISNRDDGSFLVLTERRSDKADVYCLK